MTPEPCRTPRVEIESGSKPSRTRIDSDSNRNRSRIGIESDSNRNRIGLESESSRSRIGIESESTRSRRLTARREGGARSMKPERGNATAIFFLSKATQRDDHPAAAWRTSAAIHGATPGCLSTSSRAAAMSASVMRAMCSL